MKTKAEECISSYNIISHSEPQRKLVVHLEEVHKKAKARFDKLNINFELLGISKSDFEKLLKIVVYCHDFGKASFYFQKKISQEKELSIKERKLSQHALISAFFGYFIAKEVFKLDAKMASFVFMSIRFHHLDLLDAEDMQSLDRKIFKDTQEILNNTKTNGLELNAIYKKFFDIENAVSKLEYFFKKEFSRDKKNTIYHYFHFDKYHKNDFLIFNLLFSLLIYADKQDAIFRDDIYQNKTISVLSSKVEKFKQNYFKTREKTPLDNVREKIYQALVLEYQQNKSHDIFFIKLPTGAGKTLLLYKIAMDLKEEYESKRVFYLLPFITLIEQNAQILKDLLEFMNLDASNNKIFLEKHSLSGEFVIKEDKNSNEYDIDKKDFLLDTLESEFIVTSFHQLFYGIFKRKNSLLKRFHQFINSIILIDEVQLIPLKLMYDVSLFLKFMSEIFNCKIIVASATFPKISQDILTNAYTFKSIDKILAKSEVEKFFNRYEINIDIDTIYSHETLCSKIDEKLKTKRDLLFRVNTINTANDIYDYIMQLKDTRYKKENIFLLTSAVSPYDRQKIISKIKENSQQGIKQIVVATQLIQAGVDISLEDGIEELAPLDLIIQSMGRRNRSGEKRQKGKADVVIIKNKNGFLGHRIYHAFDIRQTKNILNYYKNICEKEIIDNKILDSYYDMQVADKDVDKFLKDLAYKQLDEHFTLISSAPLSFSFFLPINKQALSLWDKLEELDIKKHNISHDKNFWKNMKAIHGEYTKIKKDVSLYVVNQNFYYEGSKKEIVLKEIGEFKSALNIYLATDDIFDRQKGLMLNKYIKDNIDGLFW